MTQNSIVKSITNMDCREFMRRDRSCSHSEPLLPVIATPPPLPKPCTQRFKSRDPSDPPPMPTSKAIATSTTPPCSTLTPYKLVDDSNKNKKSNAPKSNFQKTVSLNHETLCHFVHHHNNFLIFLGKMWRYVWLIVGWLRRN